MLRLLLIGLIFAIAPARAEPINAGKITVIDGDTVDVISADGKKERYRLDGFNAPETGDRPYRKRVTDAEKERGKKSSDRLKALLSEGPIDFKEVPCVCTPQTKRDAQGKCRTFDRLCGALSVNGKDVGQTLISEGLARKYVCTEKGGCRMAPLSKAQKRKAKEAAN